MKTFSKFKNLQSRGELAFTLIELLMVIAIIGILAALLVGSSGYAARIMKISRVKAELKQLETSIGAYKAALGSYPPDNPGQPKQPPLFYELLGMRVPPTTINSSPVYTNGMIGLTAPQAVSVLGVQGIQNAVVSSSDSEIKPFLSQLKAKRSSTNLNGSNPGVQFLIVPVDGVDPIYPTFNTWRYVSTSPTNNPHGYDLWAEVVISGKTYVIGNWKN